VWCVVCGVWYVVCVDTLISILETASVKRYSISRLLFLICGLKTIFLTKCRTRDMELNDHFHVGYDAI
jgi:hypothetical protein